MNGLDVLNEDGALSRAALVIKNMTNYKLSGKGGGTLTARAKSIAPLTFKLKKREDSPIKEEKAFVSSPMSLNLNSGA